MKNRMTVSPTYQLSCRRERDDHLKELGDRRKTLPGSLDRWTMSSNQGGQRVEVRRPPPSQMLGYSRLDKHLYLYVLSVRPLPTRISLPLQQKRLIPESVLNDGLSLVAGGLDLQLAVRIDPPDKVFDLDALGCSPMSDCLEFATNHRLRLSTRFAGPPSAS